MLSAAAPPAFQSNLTTNFPGLQTLNTTPLISEFDPAKANQSTGVAVEHIAVNVPGSTTRLEVRLNGLLNWRVVYDFFDQIEDWIEWKIESHGEQWRPRTPFRCYDNGISLTVRNQPGQHINLVVLDDIVDGLDILAREGHSNKQAKFDVYHDGVFVAKGQLRSGRPGRPFDCSEA